MHGEEPVGGKFRNRETRQKNDGGLDQGGSSRGKQNLTVKRGVDEDKVFVPRN